jgi:hypothetical protein
MVSCVCVVVHMKDIRHICIQELFEQGAKEIHTKRHTYIHTHTRTHGKAERCMQEFFEQGAKETQIHTYTHTHGRAERCLQEFFEQGAKEKELGLPISPQCNPETTSMPASQIGFIKFIVLPSYQLLGSLLPEVENICVKQLDTNLVYWQGEADTLKTHEDIKEAIGRRNSAILKCSTNSQGSLSGSIELANNSDDHSTSLQAARRTVSQRTLDLVSKSKCISGMDSQALSMRLARRTFDGCSRIPSGSNSETQTQESSHGGGLQDGGESHSRNPSKRAHILKYDSRRNSVDVPSHHESDAQSSALPAHAAGTPGAAVHATQNVDSDKSLVLSHSKRTLSPVEAGPTTQNGDGDHTPVLPKCASTLSAAEAVTATTHNGSADNSPILSHRPETGMPTALNGDELTSLVLSDTTSTPTHTETPTTPQQQNHQKQEVNSDNIISISQDNSTIECGKLQMRGGPHASFSSSMGSHAETTVSNGNGASVSSYVSPAVVLAADLNEDKIERGVDMSRV